MTTPPETAILAGGCFWGMQDLIRKRPGVISTRVGYSGGDTPDATYRNHGKHAEAIEIIFDPGQLSYRDLLEFFFQIHDPTTKNRQGSDIGAEPVGHLLHDRRAAGDRRRHDRGRGRLRPLVRQSGHRGHGGRSLLGGRTRASGLPRTVPQWLHVPLHPAELEASTPRRFEDHVTTRAVSSAGGPHGDDLHHVPGPRGRISMSARAMIAILDLGEFFGGQRGRGGGHRQRRNAAGGWLRAAGRAGADRTD